MPMLASLAERAIALHRATIAVQRNIRIVEMNDPAMAQAFRCRRRMYQEQAASMRTAA